MKRYYFRKLALLFFVSAGLLASLKGLAQYTPTVLATGGAYSAVATDRQDRVYVVAYNSGTGKYEVHQYPAGSTGNYNTIYADLANSGVDQAGNRDPTPETYGWTVDAVRPTITSVDVPANGYHTSGDVLYFIVHLDENADVNTAGGTPYLEVTVGTTTRQALYTSGSGTANFTFSYTVQPGDMDMDGITLGTALIPNGSTIRDAVGNDAALALHAIGSTAGVYINTATPGVTLSATATSPVNQPFTAKVTFTEAVTYFTLGDIVVTNATLSDFQTTDNITYSVRVSPMADGAVSLQVPAGAAVNIGHNGNTASNVLSVTYDGTAPAVASVEVPSDGYYTSGDVLNFTVHFDENVIANNVGGIPYLELTVGASTRHAMYSGGSGTKMLSFSYTVQDGDKDIDGIGIGTAVIPNGGTIRDAAGNDAVLTLHNVSSTAGVLVNTDKPSVIVFTAATSPVNQPFNINISFSEAVTGFTVDDILATNVTLSDFYTAGNINYSVMGTPVTDGVITVQVPAGVAVNIGGNSNTASNKLSLDFDGTPPVITSNGGGSTASISVAENTTSVTTVTATDKEKGSTLTYSLTGGADAAGFKINSITGVLDFKTAPDFENPTDVGKDNAYEVTVEASDGAHTATQAITVTVADVNDNTPVITSEGGGSSATVIVPENNTSVTTVKATDADAGTTLIYSIVGGIDQGLFFMGGSTGVLVFKTAPDFEHPTDVGKDNAYEVTVGVSDGAHTATQAITVTVADVNDNTPVITSNGGGSTASISIPENTTAVTTVEATDADAGTTLIYSIVGGIDQGLFSMGGSTGVLVFKTAPDFENPSDADGDNNYEVMVRASDGLNHMDQALTVTVINTNDNLPVITSNGGGSTASISISENTAAVTTVTATDNEKGATLTYNLAGGSDAASFKINSTTGKLEFKAAPDFEKPTDVGKDNAYEVTVGVSDGAHTVTQAITVAVTDVNDNTPVIISNGGGSSASISVPENTTAVTTVEATDADAGTTLIYSIVGGIDQGLFSIDKSTGKLIFKVAPDFENPSDADGDNNYEVTVRASDGLNHMDQALTVTVINANDNLPVITSNGGGSSASISVSENTTAVTTVTATDADAGTTLTYSLAGGSDAAGFKINSTTGKLEFKAAPDFEQPTDEGKDNTYAVTVGASDGAHTITQAITVTVTDVNDNTPVITSNGGGSTASISIAENTTAVTTVTATDADAGTMLTYSLIGGADKASFKIGGTTGALAFIAAPDFEQPTDEGKDNTYAVTVRASDGTRTVDQTIAVMVTDENDNIPAVPVQHFAVDENSPAHTAVGTLHATDADAGTIFSHWTITGGNTNDAFAVDANTGSITVNNSAALDYETTTTFTMKITVSDGVHTSAEETVTITLNDLPEAPTGIAFSPETLYENQPAGTSAGKFSSTAPDAGATFAYSLVPGAGDADNSLFHIEGDVLSTAVPFDYEQQTTYHIRVRTTIQSGLFLEKAFIVAIADVNEVPTLDAIADQTVCYTSSQQSIHLAGISAGEDKGQTTSLSLNTDNAGLFKSLAVSGNKIAYALADGAGGKATVTVTVQDDGGTANGGVDHMSRSFTLTVNPLPVITIVAEGTNPLSKGILTHLTASGADSYQWASGPGIQNGWNNAVLAIRPQQDATYTVTGASAEGCTAQQQYVVEVVADYQLVCNNIVSPNGDGKNDTWIIQNVDSYPNNEVMIYDRAGRMIYHKKQYDNRWNGTVNGGQLTEGTYYYVFLVDGGKKMFKGYIELLK